AHIAGAEEGGRHYSHQQQQREISQRYCKFTLIFGEKLIHPYNTGPTRHGTNSLCPSNSLFVRSPEATRRIKSKIRWPTSSTVSFPSTIVPALMSMLSSITEAMREFEAILMTGTTGNPIPEPRPVVKTIIFAPP